MNHITAYDWFSIIFTALCWAVLIGFHFRRTWGLEHGVGMSDADRLFGGDGYDLNTQIYLSSLIVPCLFFLLCILMVIRYSLVEGLRLFFLCAFCYILLISALYTVLLVLLPLLRRHFSARSCATLWLLPVFSSSYVLVYSPGTDNALLLLLQRIPNTVVYVLSFLWAFGFLILFGCAVLSHIHLYRHILRTAAPETDESVLAIWQEEQKTLGFVTPVRLVHTPAAHAPFSIGHTKKTRMCVLPIRAYHERELRLIFRHELHHLRRRDTDSKLFFAFCASLCWFDPLIWLALRQAANDLELSCDEIVLEDADNDTRTFYARLLLDTAGEHRGFTTCLSARAASLRYRLTRVLHPKKTSEGTLMLTCFMFLFMIGCGWLRWL